MNDQPEQGEDSQTLVIDESQLAALKQKAADDHNLAMGIVGGLLAGLIGAILWAVITLKTGYQIGWIAIGVGFLVGFAIKTLGKGYTPVFGVVGALLALSACVLGNYFSIIGYIAQENGLAFMDTLKQTDLNTAISIMKDTFQPMDLVFYAIAVWAGWQYSFQHLTQEELNRL